MNSGCRCLKSKQILACRFSDFEPDPYLTRSNLIFRSTTWPRVRLAAIRFSGDFAKFCCLNIDWASHWSRRDRVRARIKSFMAWCLVGPTTAWPPLALPFIKAGKVQCTFWLPYTQIYLFFKGYTREHPLGRHIRRENTLWKVWQTRSCVTQSRCLFSRPSE